MIVLDETGGWRGGGTAWKLAEDGHEVTLVTPDAMVGRELVRVAADYPLRKRLAQLGVRFITEHGLTGWGNGGATAQSALTGVETRIEADSLVLALGNRAVTELSDALEAEGQSYSLIGDAATPGQAAFAFHAGRKAALAI